MKIYIDINHPAHVHYFRNFIKIMELKGHSFVITNRDSPIINQLLDYYKIKHHIRNKRPKKQSFLNSMFYLIGIIKNCIHYSFKEHPDIYVAGGSPCAITAFLFGKPAIQFDDTEHNSINQFLYKPFCSVILTPYYFRKKLGKKQIYFDAYMEQFYLHSNYYKQNLSTLKEIGFNENEPYALVRYISYDATHDIKVRPLSNEVKKEFLVNIKNKMPVFVSLESTVTDPFYNEYKLKITPEKMHDVIAGASLFLTEGATMASEACILGVPYIYMNPLQEMGYIMEQVKKYPEIAVETIDEEEINRYIESKTINAITSEKKEEIRNEIEKSTINPTEFLVWFVENYPQSRDEMYINSKEVMNRFKK